MKIIFGVLGICLVVTRFFLLFKILQWLFYNYNVEKSDITQIQWFICAIILDIYLSTLGKEYDHNKIIDK